ncbi:MAG: thiamine phosphate synthase [Xanthobacteraceae bacterium]|nr:thiamine phosphate synthase [Xanthobacteraceae bacterium]
MAKKPQPVPPRPAPQLYLVTPAVADAEVFLRDLSAALDAAPVAAVLLRLAPADERTMINRIKALAPRVQQANAALVVDGQPDLIGRGGADGAQLPNVDDLLAALPQLKPDRIAGVGGLVTRHDAMVAAEAGADYVMFGEPDAAGTRPGFAAVEERVGWWAEVFEAPCVGYAGALDEVAPLVKAGADFVAVGEFVWTDPAGPGAAILAAHTQLTLEAVE